MNPTTQCDADKSQVGGLMNHVEAFITANEPVLTCEIAERLSLSTETIRGVVSRLVQLGKIEAVGMDAIRRAKLWAKARPKPPAPKKPRVQRFVPDLMQPGDLKDSSPQRAGSMDFKARPSIIGGRAVTYRPGASA